MHKAKQNHMCFFPKIEQPVRSIECNERSLNLMSTTVLRDSTKKKRRTLLKEF